MNMIIGEMAKDQIGLKWPSPMSLSYFTYKSNKHNINQMPKCKTKTKTCPKIIKTNQELYLALRT